MSESYDLIVIGAGMAGVAAANKCAAGGWRVAIVDSLPYGGTCALRGCDPKKILRRGAEVIDGARLMRGKGIDEGGLRINWGELMTHKHGFTDPVPQSMEDNLTAHGVDTLHGHARFTGPNRLEVNDIGYTAERVLVATGARPRPLGFPGHEHVIDSTDFLDLDALPPRILFVGGGFVSFEFAHLAARAGCSTVIVDRGARPLKQFDPDLVELLVDRGREVGVELRRSTTITAVQPVERGYRVTLECAGQAETIETDLVVHGAGRVAALDGLGLDTAGVRWGERGVHVHGHLQSTTNPAVWAAGDSADTAGMPLTPVAVSEAKVAASNMLKATTTTPDYTGIPTAVFTIPELVRVGMSEAQAREQNIDLAVRYSNTSDWYSSYRVGETTSAAKILIDRTTDLIVGAHLLGPEAGELVNTLGLAIKLSLTTGQLKSATAAYPTHGSDLGALLQVTPGDNTGRTRHEFSATAPNQLWLTDITEHPTGEGKLQECAVKDCYSNKIVGYSIDSRMTSTLAVSALRNAIGLRSPPGTICHPDRGSQFRSKQVVRILANNGLRGSMGRVGSSGDNAAMESFFSLLQKNVLNSRGWVTRQELRLAIVVWIETKYNRRLPQRALGRLTPVEFEMIYTTATAA